MMLPFREALATSHLGLIIHHSQEKGVGVEVGWGLSFYNEMNYSMNVGRKLETCNRSGKDDLGNK
jgi:hypothetical protein